MVWAGGLAGALAPSHNAAVQPHGHVKGAQRQLSGQAMDVCVRMFLMAYSVDVYLRRAAVLDSGGRARELLQHRRVSMDRRRALV